LVYRSINKNISLLGKDKNEDIKAAIDWR